MGKLTQSTAEIQSILDEANGVREFVNMTAENIRQDINALEIKSEENLTELEDSIDGKLDSLKDEIQEELRSASKCIPITYNDLRSLRNRGGLVAGTYYRIIDYVTTTTQQNTMAAGRLFDVIVLALTKNKLSEEAYACLPYSEDDDYFDAYSCNLSAWKIWYCLDNDADRFAWAVGNGKVCVQCSSTDSYLPSEVNGSIINVMPVYEADFVSGLEILYKYDLLDGTQIMLTEGGYVYTEGERHVGRFDVVEGKGVIYRMIDEFGNDCPYDFKNIQFKRDVYEEGGLAESGEEDYSLWCYTFSFRGENGEVIDASIFGNYGSLIDQEDDAPGVYNNIMGKCRDRDYDLENTTRVTQILNNNVFFACYEYDYGLFYGWSSNVIGEDCNSNSFGEDCHSNVFDEGCSGNTLGNYCLGNKFGASSRYNKLGHFCSGNTFGVSCTNIQLGDSCAGNHFGYGCGNNSFGVGCSCNTFGNQCSFNKFCGKDTTIKGNYYKYNRFGDNFYNCSLINAETASSKYCVQNYSISLGVTQKEIVVTRNLAYETTIATNPNGTIVSFNIADLA